MKQILTILLIIWMIVIFLLSSENSDVSTNRTNLLTHTVIELKEKILNEKLSEKEIEKIQDDIFIITRKIAHITEYFILGILMFLRVGIESNYDKKSLILSILFCILYSISDEFHQFFVPGRTAKLMDVFIDSIGFLTSSMMIYLINSYKIKKNLCKFR